MHFHISSHNYGVADLARETLHTIFLRFKIPGIASLVKSDGYDIFNALSDTAPLCKFPVHLQCATPAETRRNSELENWHTPFLIGLLSRYAMLVNGAQTLTGAR
jgi:hypothetical protein